MSFTDVELDYLSTQRLGRLATAQSDGTLQVSPVGFRPVGPPDRHRGTSGGDGNSAARRHTGIVARPTHTR